MSFNLKANKNRRFLDKLRSLHEDCNGLRPSDLDGMSEKEMYHLYHKLNGKKAGDVAPIKTALHGRGETWTPVGPGFDPYKTSPLVNFQGPEFGGRWRRDFPGGGDNHINDDSDKEKNTKGQAAEGDFDPQLQQTRINELTDKIKGPKYTVRLRLSEEDEPSKSKAKEIFGDEGQTDGRSIYVVVDGFERAMRLMQKNPGSVIEPKGA
jgi:hypothetical protein